MSNRGPLGGRTFTLKDKLFCRRCPLTRLLLIFFCLFAVVFFIQYPPNQLMDPIKFYWPQLISIRPLLVFFTRNFCDDISFFNISLCRQSRLFLSVPTAKSAVPDQVYVSTSNRLGGGLYDLFFRSANVKKPIILFGHIDEVIVYDPSNIYVFIDTEPFSLSGFEDFFPSMLYIGHLQFPDDATKGVTAPAQSVYLPYLFLNMLEFYQSPNISLQLTSSGTFNERKYFAIYAQSKCIPFREQAYDLLVEFAEKHRLGEVHAIGGCHGSHPETRIEVPGNNIYNLSVFKNYKYSLTAENSPQVPGYMTEKILSPFLADTVPIYFGTENILKVFDTDTFFYMANMSEFESLLSTPDHFTEDKRRAMVSKPKFTKFSHYSLSITPAFKEAYYRDNAASTIVMEILNKTKLIDLGHAPR